MLPEPSFRAAQLFRMERILMSKELKAIAIFAGMIALPIVADNLISRKPDIRLFGGFEWAWALVPIVILCAVAIPLVIQAFWKFEEEIQGIQGNLKLAERELTKFLADNWDQGGRLGKVKERAEWAAMAHPTINHTVRGDLSSLPGEAAKWNPLVQSSIAQTFNEGYLTVAHEACELNRADMAGRGTAMGKATMTAVLLRELYQGSPGRAQKKVSGELKSGGTPFVAPGVRELLDFDSYDKSNADKEKWGFPKDNKAVNWLMLTLAVKQGQFPKELVLVDKGTPTPEGTPTHFRGWEVIKKLTEPGSKKDWDIPKPPEPITMWRLWVEWLFTWE